MRPALLLRASLALLLAAPLANADPTAADIAVAKRLFSEALVLEDAAAWSAAAEKLRRALAIKETPGLRYHLAHCEEQSGALVAASQNYERAAVLIRAGAQAPDVEQVLGLASQRIAARLPKLKLIAPADVKDLSVAIDDTPVEPEVLGKLAPIDPGPHRITARAPAHRDFSTVVEIRTAEIRTLELTLEPVSLSLAAPTAAEQAAASVPTSAPSGGERSSFGAREVTLVSEGALTLAGLGMGIGYALARSATAEDIERLQDEVDASGTGGTDSCDGPMLSQTRACAELRASLDAHERATTLSTAGFIGAGVGAAAFVLTWVLWPSSRKTTTLELTPRAVGFDIRAAARF